MKAFDAIVIGAGIVGAACAERLSREGVRVALVERNRPGSGATAAAMGHIVVMDDSEAQLQLTGFSRGLWDRLSANLPAAAAYWKCGTIWIATSDEEMEHAASKKAILASFGIESELLDATGLYRHEPNLAEGLVGGLRVPGDAIVYQPVIAEHLVAEAERSGASILRSSEVKTITDYGVELVTGEKVAAELVVNAAGLHAARLSPELAIEYKKGHLLITDRRPGFANHQLVELGYIDSAHRSENESVAFNVQPRETGQLLIGSSRQPGDASEGIDRKLVSSMVERAFRFMPGLRNMNVLRIWTGVRPATPDNLPYIGPSTRRPGVFIAAGHEGLGITTALATAEFLADHVAGRKSEIPTAPYEPARLTK